MREVPRGPHSEELSVATKQASGTKSAKTDTKTTAKAAPKDLKSTGAKSAPKQK